MKYPGLLSNIGKGPIGYNWPLQEAHLKTNKHQLIKDLYNSKDIERVQKFKTNLF